VNSLRLRKLGWIWQPISAKMFQFRQEYYSILTLAYDLSRGYTHHFQEDKNSGECRNLRLFAGPEIGAAATGVSFTSLYPVLDWFETIKADRSLFGVPSWRRGFTLKGRKGRS
jgi:hypothetical protein